MDYIASAKLRISHSQQGSWERCPRKWYLEQIEGLRIKEHLTSLPLRMGKELQRIQSKEDIPPTFFSEEEAPIIIGMHRVMDVIENHELLPENAVWEQELFKETFDGGALFHGKVDLSWINEDGKKYFGEIKFTSRPDYFLSNFTARSQIEGYFFLDDEYHKAFIMPIRVANTTWPR